MKKVWFKILFVSCTLWAAGCGNSEEQAKEAAIDEATEKMEEAVSKLEEATKEGVVATEPIDFRELKELLPKSAAGIDQTESKGEKAGAMGLKMSTAESSYIQDDKEIKVKITDIGALADGMGSMMTAAWLMTEVDRETDTEYEKTTEFEGYRGYEKYNSEYKNGTLTFIVADRFIVEVSGNNVEMDDIKDAAKSVDLGGLEDRKDEGKNL